VEAHQFVGKDDPLLGGVQVVVGYSPGAVAAGLEVGGGDADIRWRGGEVGIQLGDHPVDAEAGVVDIVDDQDAARRLNAGEGRVEALHHHLVVAAVDAAVVAGGGRGGGGGGCGGAGPGPGGHRPRWGPP